ncbi:MAG TPA: putative manganese transporter [Thermoanaerobaculaceae bacterium]|nr:putative manganese transporter [Thermoanaerobaculaceae bacterium]HRS17020.1 putative manganese transporter [Thermoanaerobaculaceae bacterium]
MSFQRAIAETLMITGFVFVMMLLVEYLQVRSAGLVGRWLRRGGLVRTAAVTLVALVPGCLGAFTDVTLYTHGMISFGALAGAMIAGSGDAAFLMLAVAPGAAVGVFGVLFVYGLLVALLVDRAGGARYFRGAACPDGIALHADELTARPGLFRPPRLRDVSLPRALLAAALALFLAGVSLGLIGPERWTWVRWTLLVLATLALAVVVTVPEHFLQEHLFGHVARRHTPRVFAWVLGVSLGMAWLDAAGLPVAAWIADHQALALGAAVLLGIIPDSGPQLVFVTLFAQGVVPLSVLMTSAVVQDGHGLLPLLAESPAEFVKVKSVNVAAGLLLGGALMLLGW